MPETAAIQIYGLADPVTDEVRYIGKAKNALVRYKGHLSKAATGKTPVYCWIRGLSAPPKLVVLASCLTQDWQSVERQMIAQYRQTNSLLNLADGGNQPKVSIETNRKNGKALAARLKSDPILARVQAAKKAMSMFLRHVKTGKISKEVADPIIAKLRLAGHKNPRYFGEYRYL